MPAFTPMSGYNLTPIQIDLILYALNQVDLSDAEDNERRKIADVFYTTEPINYTDPYANYCDI